ncbi:DISARM system phospholipase D-like protein DrmC [Nordella sp. HKS 07]|uniref:DISARM system phospholipase D-like protein DrmC n=1 Tax=Nordella sp. HKS 07 TaxID=2712222 RepID=UPI0019D27F24|nr:DISARM system phospholipase D-like protein DrmC [Nordella sp. HKS 07]
MELVSLLSPSKIGVIAARVRRMTPLMRNHGLYRVVGTPAAQVALDRLLTAWERASIAGDVLAGILLGAAHARQETLRETSVEFVWTGPTTPFVATRRTEQVLLDIIRNARTDLFLVSFVAHGVSSIVDELNAAAHRDIEIRILMETSTSDGGSLSVDHIAPMKRLVPTASMYGWISRSAPFSEGKVHAKLAVADGSIAFLTSANLTGHALEKNMEAGVVIKGGHIPMGLRAHLHSLIETKVIRRV